MITRSPLPQCYELLPPPLLGRRVKRLEPCRGQPDVRLAIPSTQDPDNNLLGITSVPWPTHGARHSNPQPPKFPYTCLRTYVRTYVRVYVAADGELVRWQNSKIIYATVHLASSYDDRRSYGSCWRGTGVCHVVRGGWACILRVVDRQRPLSLASSFSRFSLVHFSGTNLHSDEGSEFYGREKWVVP